VKAHQSSATGCRIGRRNQASTCSEDGFVKVWDVLDLDNGRPRLIHTQNPKCVRIKEIYRENSFVWNYIKTVKCFVVEMEMGSCLFGIHMKIKI
jgi:hypothetical protein